jgi:hypothetical protein
MKRKLISTLVASLAMIAAAIITGYLSDLIFPSLHKEYENTSLYRSWEDPLMYLYFIQPFILTAALIWGWDKIKHLFKGSVGLKAFYLSLIYMFISVVPGMLMTISTFNVSMLAILTWTISSFIQILVASLLFIRIVRS